MMMANLPLNIIEEIFSRVPISSLKAIKITCNEWNALSKDRIFQKKHRGKAGKEIMAIKVNGFELLLMSVNVHGIHNNLVDPFFNQIGKLNQVKMSQVFHCDGLLLCVSESDPRIMVWNPYLCQIRWIQPTRPYLHNKGCFNILGYDNNKNHKILRFCNWVRPYKNEIYYFKSGSWRVHYFTQCVSDEDHVVLSVFKEEQLAVLKCDFFEAQTSIWITTKIEPTTVSWRSFIKFNTSMIGFLYGTRSFLVEEKKKVAAICYVQFR